MWQWRVIICICFIRAPCSCNQSLSKHICAKCLRVLRACESCPLGRGRTTIYMRGNRTHWYFYSIAQFKGTKNISSLMNLTKFVQKLPIMNIRRKTGRQRNRLPGNCTTDCSYTSAQLRLASRARMQVSIGSLATHWKVVVRLWLIHTVWPPAQTAVWGWPCGWAGGNPPHCRPTPWVHIQCGHNLKTSCVQAPIWAGRANKQRACCREQTWAVVPRKPFCAKVNYRQLSFKWE